MGNFNGHTLTKNLFKKAKDLTSKLCLQLLKNAYQNTHIGAYLEAEKYVINFSDIFKTNGHVKVGALWKGKDCEGEFNLLD